MNITLIRAPIATGMTQRGMALAPSRYLEAGANRVLARGGHGVETASLHRGEPGHDLEDVVAVNAELAATVRDATRRGRFPLVLGGACNVCLGALAGLHPRPVGVVWLDAHGDFNTPETTPSGYFDGMPLAIATGRGHQEMRARIGDGPPVPDERVILAGVRDLDPGERAALENSQVQVMEVSRMLQDAAERALLPALDRLGSRVDEVYLHLDIDVLDPEAAPAVNFPTVGGLSIEEVQQLIALVGERFRIVAASLTAYDPTRDPDGETLEVALRLLERIARAAACDAERGTYGSQPQG